MTNSGIGRSRVRTGSILIVLLSFALIGSSAAKFVPSFAAQMAALGFDGGRLIFIAALESLSAILFLVPRTRAFGLLMVSAYMGGAIATHVGHGQSIARPAVVLALFWIASWLRHPQILWSFGDHSETESVARIQNGVAAR